MSPFFRTRLFKNLGLKLLSLLLASTVYAHVVTEKEREVDLIVPLKLTRVPTGMMVLGDPPPALEIRAKGTGKQLLWLRLFKIEAHVPLADAKPGHFEHVFSPSDIGLPPGSGVTVTQIIEPRLLSLDVDALASRKVKVFPTVVGVPASGYAVAGSPRAVPDSVLVTGARRLVEKVDLLRSASVDVSNSREKTVAKVPVETRDPGITVVPKEVTVEVPVERLAEEKLERAPTAVLRSAQIGGDPLHGKPRRSAS